MCVERKRRGNQPLKSGDPSCSVHLKVEGSLYDRLYASARARRQTVNEYIRSLLRASASMSHADAHK